MTTSLRHHPIAAQRERNARIREQAERVAELSGLQRADAPLPVAVIPANTRETTRLPQTSRREFLDRLAIRVRNVFAAPPVDENAAPTAEMEAARAAAEDAPPSADAAASTILGLSCGTCRGECCTAGGTHAFLREDSVLRVRTQHPEWTEAQFIEAYAAELPTRHYRGSCVYHTTSGCALPRAMRSNICNRYLCGGLTQLKRALDASGSGTAFVGAADSVHLRRMAIIDASGAKAVAVGQSST